MSIFNQAKAAEDFKLPDVAGPGYRKALEFLVKDYLIDENPGDADAIKKEQLGDVIANRVTDPRVKEVASRAAWLGNDETHYERRWKDKDIQDLKKMVRLTLIWVESCILSRRMEQDMPHPIKARATKD